MSADPRARARRQRDTEHRLANDVDLWVATASADGAPYLVPLSFDWDGEALLVATPTDSPTGRNLAATRTVRLGLGHTRDVSMIDGEVEVIEIDALPQERGVIRMSPRVASWLAWSLAGLTLVVFVATIPLWFLARGVDPAGSWSADVSVGGLVGGALFWHSRWSVP